MTGRAGSKPYTELVRSTGIRRPVLVAVLTVWALAGGPARAADGLKLSFDDGRVTLSAAQVPISEILKEWARVGNTRFVDGEELADGPPLTLQLTDVPEAEALELLLRAASGYLAAPRAVRVAGTSRFDRVLIMATSRGPRPAPAGVSPVTPLVGAPATPEQELGQPTPGFNLMPGAAGGATTFEPPARDPSFDPNQAEQLEQLQQLLQQPSFPDGAFGDPQFAPDPGLNQQPEAGQQTAPRPGMIINAPEETPGNRRGPMAVRPPFGDPGLE